MLKQNYRIEVIEDDIRRATRKNSVKCIVATAVKRSIPGTSNISVDLQAVRFTLEGRRFLYLTPMRVAKYVVDFDFGTPIEPFKFSLRHPQIMRRKHQPVDPSAPKAKPQSKEHNKKKGQRHPKETITLGTKQSTRKHPVMAATRMLPSGVGGRVRMYGSRLLHINHDRPEGSTVELRLRPHEMPRKERRRLPA